jgi:hypothetical protein
MKIAMVIAVVAAVATIWLVAKSRAQESLEAKPGAATTKASEPKDIYIGLRNTMLQGSRSKFSLAPAAKPNEPWGVLMDWGMRNGTATVVVAADGSASVYFSSGGGYLGGIGQEPIRRAAQKAVEVARAVQLPSQPTTAYPLPEMHGVFFYFMTDAGVFVLRTSEQELNSPSHPLRKIGDAMQGVITDYRLWDEQRKKTQSR